MPGSGESSFWASEDHASPGGSTSRGKAPCAPYDCKEILDFVAAHPEARCELLMHYVRRQQMKAESVKLG